MMTNSGLLGEIEYYRSRTRQLERALEKVLSTPAPGSMTAEQFKNRICGGIVEALTIHPPKPVYAPESEYWRDENEGYTR